MKVLVVTGSSGGHIFPALSFIERLRAGVPEATIVLVLPRVNALGTRLPAGCSVKYIFMRPFSGNLRRRVMAVFDFLRGSLQSFLIVGALRPDTAVGFGSIASVPAMFFAWLFRARTIIHEQNVVPGKANRVLAWFADRIAVSFEDTRSYFAAYAGKVSYTGNPVRSALKRIEPAQARVFFGLEPDDFTILVMGGSQGSASINRLVPEALRDAAAKFRFQVIHLCGKSDERSVAGAYCALGVKARVFGFFDRMEYAYSAADLCIGRAGATTLSELKFFHLPALLVPYPYAGAHQARNAAVLENAGCGLMIDEGVLAERLPAALGSLLADKGILARMRENFSSRTDDPAGEIVRIIVAEGEK